LEGINQAHATWSPAPGSAILTGVLELTTQDLDGQKVAKKGVGPRRPLNPLGWRGVLVNKKDKERNRWINPSRSTWLVGSRLYPGKGGKKITFKKEEILLNSFPPLRRKTGLPQEEGRETSRE